MCLLSYAGFLRYSELSNLMRNHVTFYEQRIKLFLECSKTDVYREGRNVLIFKTDNSTCSVNMLSRYCVLTNIAPDSTYYLFRPLCFCSLRTHTNCATENYLIPQQEKPYYPHLKLWD